MDNAELDEPTARYQSACFVPLNCSNLLLKPHELVAMITFCRSEFPLFNYVLCEGVPYQGTGNVAKGKEGMEEELEANRSQEKAGALDHAAHPPGGRKRHGRG